MEILDRSQRLRKVTYTTSNGVVIIDGDVTYGTEEEFAKAVDAAKRTNPGFASDRQRRALSWTPGTNARPGAEVLYAYENATAEASAGEVMKRGIEAWKAKAPFLKFTKQPFSKKGTPGVLVITTEECGGCSAPVGYHNESMPMIMQSGCPGRSEACAVSEAIHELGHSLGKSMFSKRLQVSLFFAGLFHEHQRPDRKEFVDFLCQNVDPVCNTMPAGKTCCDYEDDAVPLECCEMMTFFEDMDVGPETYMDAEGSYDLLSVMHYRADASAQDGKITLVSKNPQIPIPLLGRDQPSEGDVARLCKRYPKECAPERSSNNTSKGAVVQTSGISLTPVSLSFAYLCLPLLTTLLMI